MPAVIDLLQCFVPIREQEVEPVVYSFSALFTILTSYFLLLPLREDAGISLGTSTLPVLFACSLVVTLIVTPAVTAYINSKGHAQGRDAALRQFYRIMALILLGFFLLYNFSVVEGWVDQLGLAQQRLHTPLHSSSQPTHPLDALLYHQRQQQQRQQEQQQWAQHGFHAQQQQQQGGAPSGDGIGSGAGVHHQRQQQHRQLRQLLQARPIPTSDHFSFSSSSAAVQTTTISSTTTTSSSRGADKVVVSTRSGDPSLTKHQRRLRAAFYVWVNVMNLVGISSLWAKCADAFSPDAGARLFGFISAGATLGQLAGSLIAMLASWVAGAMLGQVHDAAATHSSSSSSSSSSRQQEVSSRAVPASSLLLVAAVLQLAAAQLVTRIRPAAAAVVPAMVVTKLPDKNSSSSSSSNGVVGDGVASPTLARRSGGVGASANEGTATLYSVAANGKGSSSNGAHTMDSSSSSSSSIRKPGGRDDPRLKLSKVLTGFQLIWRSPYLLLVCSNLLLTYVVGSLMYFQRALVVSAAAAVHGPAFRTSFFAALNTWSAAAILMMQLCATSSLLRWLGMSAALGLAPAICLSALLGVASCPLPWMVAVSEVMRKIFGYAVLRPAREVLFTVVSREEKYSAKLVIDTVIQRLGDALAAAVFQVLDVQYSLGQAGVGAAGCLMCVVWLLTALALGRKHKQLAGVGAALKS